jgi:8-oxo-dGTP pyrophosphatase MutT (NUDIX family)
MRLDQNSLEQQLVPKLKNIVSIPACDAENWVPASVLVPFVWQEDEWHLMYTRRTNGVATHQGEISFPGGAFDEEDKSPIDTALRETFEEIGISRNDIKILGSLEPYPTISKFCVLPVIGIINWPTEVSLSPNEVEKVFFYPVSWLVKRENWHEENYTHSSGESRQVIRYTPRDGEVLWGMTAGITQIVLNLL